ncbi:hypothetical protein Pelo_17150 [Pelomyxa schiedti]|nr:hypothetical protein Pelo_17150 [Pelomyxa schiedti]
MSGVAPADDLDALLESALREYESNTSSTTSTTHAQPPPPAPDQQAAPQSQQANGPTSTTTVVTVAEPQPTAGVVDTTAMSTGTAALTMLRSLSEEIKKMGQNIGGILTEGLQTGDQESEDSEVQEEVQEALIKVLKPLVSKQLLYPSVLLMKEKMPSWIEKNAPKLSPENLQKCRRQQQCINEICTIFESKENPDDEDTLSILQLFQEVQLFQLPPEFAASLLEPLPQIPSTKSSDPCAIM